MTSTLTVNETGVELHPNPARVIARLFVPGREDVGPGDSRAASVVKRILQLDEREIDTAMHDVYERFSHRHRDLDAILHRHAEMVRSRIDPLVDLSPARLLLLGASFTHEYAIEGAALCNPSAVLHPEQDSSSGDAAFILSVRGIGEGHRSSIGFRTGLVGANGKVTVDPPGPFPKIEPATAGLHSKAVFHAKLAELDDDRENAAFVLDPLAPQFTDAELDARIEILAADIAMRRHTSNTIANLRHLAASSYRVEFSTELDLSERVLWPSTPAEAQGMEDARFVRFIGESGEPTYYATYTAFNGTSVAQHLLETKDFAVFKVSPMAGAAAVGKGLALFPRKIHGTYAALSRSDRETNAIAFSNDIHCWPKSRPLQMPERTWEILQLGNCGSPIETDAGWLVLTHGVGPMRTYSLGAILLDLNDPKRVLARSEQPILSPGKDGRDGYVPNVIYSCGGFAHGDTLVLPYGIADHTTSIATLSIAELLASLR